MVLFYVCYVNQLFGAILANMVCSGAFKQNRDGGKLF